MITISLSFLWIALIVVAVVQGIKLALQKWADKVVPFLPYIIFVVLAIVYLITSHNVGTACINALVLTSLSVYFYDVIKPLITFIKDKIKK